MLFGTLRRRGGQAALWLLVGLLIGGTVGALGAYFLKRGKSGIPGGPRLGGAEELSLVPPDALGFVHLRARDLWHTDGFAEVRKIIEKAGPKAVAVIDEDFVPAPSTLDRVTLVFVKAPHHAAHAPPNQVEPPPGAPKGPGKGPNQPRKNAQPGKGGFAPPPQPPAVGFPGDMFRSLGDDLEAVIIIAFNQPFDAGKVREAYLKGATKSTIAAREYSSAPNGEIAMHFPEDNKNAMVLGSSTGMKAYLSKLATTTGPLTSAIAFAREGGHHVVASLNVAQLGLSSKMFELAPDVQPFAKDLGPVIKAESLTIGLGLGEEMKLEIRAKYKDDGAATESEAALRKLAALGREKLAEPKKEMEKLLNGKPDHAKPRPIDELAKAVLGLLGLGSINSLDEWLADPPLTREGSEVILAPKAPSLAAAYVGGIAASVGVLLPATQNVRESAVQAQSSSNLKQLGLGMWNYASSNQDRLPMPAYTIGPGDHLKQPGGLSWRVHLLPYMEQQNLYNQFHIDEPWDSPHNKTLIDQMPKVYASPNAPPVPGKTYYKVCTGIALFNAPMRYTIANIPDGTSNTIMVIEGGAPVTWTKPDDFIIDKGPLPDMKLNGNPRINILLADGSVRGIDLNAISEQTLRNAICPDDGQVLGPDW